MVALLWQRLGHIMGLDLLVAMELSLWHFHPEIRIGNFCTSTNLPNPGM